MKKTKIAAEDVEVNKKATKSKKKGKETKEVLPENVENNTNEVKASKKKKGSYDVKNGFFSKLGKILKNRVVVLILLLILMAGSVFFLFLLDKDNGYRPDALDNIQFFKSLSILIGQKEEYNITMICWFTLFLFWFGVLAIYASFALRKTFFKAFEKKYFKDFDVDMLTKRPVFNFHLGYFLFALGLTGVFYVLFISLFPTAQLASYSVDVSLLINALLSSALFLIFLAIVPVVIAIIVLIVKLIKKALR